MKAYRAQEILQSEHKIDVEWNGVAVWIDSVDTERDLVRMHPQNQPAQTRTVAAEELYEVQ